jgi:tetratricopeptide (TPR) repeat protein
MRFADVSRAGCLGAALAALAACGASTPRQAADPKPLAITPSEVATAQAVDPSAATKTQKPAKTERGRAGKAERAKGAPEDPAAAPVPEAAAAAYARASTAAQSANWVQAELELEQLVRDYPGYVAPHVSLAVAYLADGRRGDAESALNAALAIDPGDPAANDQLGILLREQGKFADAERAYRRALAADPGYGRAHYNLAVLLDLYLRRPSEALEHYEQYQSSLAEPDPNVARWIVDLKRRAGAVEPAPRVAQEE